MKSVDEDHCLTALCHCWLTLHVATLVPDSLITFLNEMGEKYGYTTKTYNMLAVALMLKNDQDRALKICESALIELKVDNIDGEQKHLYTGNNDLAVLLVNYIKCNTLRGGCGMGLEYFKTDPVNQKLIAYLGKVNQTMLTEFLEERKNAENMFDDAVKQLQ